MVHVLASNFLQPAKLELISHNHFIQLVHDKVSVKLDKIALSINGKICQVITTVILVFLVIVVVIETEHVNYLNLYVDY